jgi:hypothetical protein
LQWHLDTWVPRSLENKWLDNVICAGMEIYSLISKGLHTLYIIKHCFTGWVNINNEQYNTKRLFLPGYRLLSWN